ncbi:putative thioesterase family protein [Phaeoacremonium minimum UCRPA7]|uniref:Putative thioesterase family protein n=1 Tax=Phaeoacremonium minimum (strain UCR-PA7) TaxID=1286976 RepID=R8BC11_PHAM7|nr:putative thioesterase family protein [Phaeoacremonium minimum UCRPA7]EON96842.1 putative thioesterase family protein [Phaeoacremonium minimum UCRPA7]
MSSSRIPTILLPLVRGRPIISVSKISQSSRTFAARSIATTAGTAQLQPSFLRRTASFTGRAVLFTVLGFVMSVAPAYQTVSGLMTPITDEDTLSMFVPATPEEQAVEDFINNHPLAKQLREHPNFTESRPPLKIPPSYRSHNLTGGTLLGPGCVIVPPFAWNEAGGKSYVQICHLGENLCGYPGIIHGGFLATMLDEGLARTCFAALPNKVGMTANLNINYRAPAAANQYVVLRGTTTKVEGRKAWVEGRIETLVGEGETPVVLADATALFISPKQGAAMAVFYASS